MLRRLQQYHWIGLIKKKIKSVAKFQYSQYFHSSGYLQINLSKCYSGIAVR